MTKDLLVKTNMKLAEKIAKSRTKKMYSISYEEIKSAAYMGLVQAAHNYDSSKSDCFAAYASVRIIGAIQDYLREMSWGSRGNNLKSDPDFIIENIAQNIEYKDHFEDIVKSLPSLNKKVLQLYYQDNKKIKEIGLLMNLHQSRISQILSNSYQKLKEVLL